MQASFTVFSKLVMTKSENDEEGEEGVVGSSVQDGEDHEHDRSGDGRSITRNGTTTNAHHGRLFDE